MEFPKVTPLPFDRNDRSLLVSEDSVLDAVDAYEADADLDDCKTFVGSYINDDRIYNLYLIAQMPTEALDELLEAAVKIIDDDRSIGRDAVMSLIRRTAHG